jgi:hypothetical protein
MPLLADIAEAKMKARGCALVAMVLAGFEAIFARYPKASAIGFATIPATDEGGLSIAAVNRMIAGAVRGVKARKM